MSSSWRWSPYRLTFGVPLSPCRGVIVRSGALIAKGEGESAGEGRGKRESAGEGEVLVRSREAGDGDGDGDGGEVR